MYVPIIQIQLNPPFRDHHFLLRSMSLPILPQISQKMRGTFGRNQKKKNTTAYLRIQVLAELSIGMHPLKLYCHLKKKHRRSNAIVERGPFFCVLSYKNEIRQNCVISLVFSYHIGGTCPVKEISWSRNGACFGTKKKPRRTSLVFLQVVGVAHWGHCSKTRASHPQFVPVAPLEPLDPVWNCCGRFVFWEGAKTAVGRRDGRPSTVLLTRDPAQASRGHFRAHHEAGADRRRDGATDHHENRGSRAHRTIGGCGADRGRFSAADHWDRYGSCADHTCGMPAQIEDIFCASESRGSRGSCAVHATTVELH